MTKIIGVIGARLNSARLPKKHLLELAGDSVIGHIFRRLETIREIDALVLATTADEYNKSLVEWAIQHGKQVYVHPGNVNDLVGRVHEIVKRYDPDVIGYFCGDSPLIEPSTVARMVTAMKLHPEAQAVVLADPPDGREYIHEGFSIFCRATWERIVLASDRPQDREHVGYALRKFYHELATITVIEDEIFHLLKHRISIDTPSDYQFMREVYRRWYETNDSQSIVPLRWVIEQLSRDQSLGMLNRHVQQKGAEETAKRVLFFVHAGSDYGLGHIKRSVLLAKALQDWHKMGVTMVTIGSDVSLLDIVPELGIMPHQFVSAADELNTVVRDAIHRDGCDAVIVDLCRNKLPDEFVDVLKFVRSNARPIIALDGLKGWEEYLDLACYPSFYLAKDSHGSLREERVIYGWDYYLLQSCPPAKVERVRQNRLIVASGGSDPTALSQYLPGILDEYLIADTEVHWIQGPYAQAPDIPKEPRLRWRVHKSPVSLMPIMQQMSYALTSYGVTFFECLACGLPTVVFSPYSFTKLDELDALREARVALVAKSPADAVKCLAELMASPAESRRLAAVSRRAIDGLGSKRLAQRIADVITN